MFENTILIANQVTNNICPPWELPCNLEGLKSKQCSSAQLLQCRVGRLDAATVWENANCNAVPPCIHNQATLGPLVAHTFKTPCSIHRDSIITVSVIDLIAPIIYDEPYCRAYNIPEKYVRQIERR